MEKDINNWLINLAKNENGELSKKVLTYPSFNIYFWKGLISIINDPRMLESLKSENFFNDVFKIVGGKVSLLDELNNIKIINLLMNEKKSANYMLVNYLLKNPENTLLNLYNKHDYPFTTEIKNYNNITVLPINLLNDFFEHIIKNEIDVDNSKKNKFYDIPTSLYLELLNSYTDILSFEKYPSFFNQVKSMFYLLDILVFDEDAEKNYLSLKNKINKKILYDMPFVVTENKKSVLVGEFEYMLLNTNKYFTKIILNATIKNSFFDVINNMVKNKNKENSLPSTELLIKSLHENLKKEESYFYKHETSRYRYRENIRDINSILHVSSLIEKLEMLYNIIKNEPVENKTENKNLNRKRRI